MPNLLTDAWAGFKAAIQRDPPTTRPPFPGGSGTPWRWAKDSEWDWERAAGDPTENSVLTIALRWIQTNLVAAPIGVQRGAGTTGTWQPTHPVMGLLRTPTPVYGFPALVQSALLDHVFRGTGYFLKVWNKPRTEVLQLWYEPYATIRPRWPVHPTPADPLITSYEVYRDGAWLELPFTDDVIAWTNGAMDLTTRRGPDPLRAFREERALARAVDDYLATTLRNFGVAGMIVAPLTNQRIQDGQGLKDRLTTTTTGENRGGVVVLSEPVNVTFPGAAPNTMPVEALDGRIEERLTAALGLNRLVVNLGKDGTFANQAGAERQAWLDCVVPLQGSLCDVLQRRLLPHFTNRADDTLAFDTSAIQALAENKKEQATVDAIYVNAGIFTPNEVRAVRGQPPHPDGNKLGRPSTAPPVPPVVPGTVPMEPGVPVTNGNGTQH